MQQPVNTASTRRSLLLGSLSGIVWICGVVAIFMSYRDPVFGDWNNGVPSNLVFFSNVAAYFSANPLMAAGIPCLFSRRFRNPRSIALLCLGGILPIALLVFLFFALDGSFNVRVSY